MTPDEADRRLRQITETAKTYVELGELIRDEYAATSGAIFGVALKFIAECKTTGLGRWHRDAFDSGLRRLAETDDNPEIARHLNCLERAS